MNRNIIMVLTGALVAGLLGLSVFNWYRATDVVTGTVIADDVQKLAQIFTKIHRTCRILSFDYQKNPINFLNVKSFAGSEVGSMNLAYPTKWEGPYVDDNLTVQGKEYMVVNTDKGYFITPGEGVELPNDKVIGVDIELNEDADIPEMMRDENKLMYQGRSLAARMIDLNQPFDADLADLEE